jgi:hypothetical protein
MEDFSTDDACLDFSSWFDCNRRTFSRNQRAKLTPQQQRTSGIFQGKFDATCRANPVCSARREIY